MGQKGSMIFDENPDINGAPAAGSTGVLFFTQYSVCVCHFLVIFYRENANMSMELQDFLLF